MGAANDGFRFILELCALAAIAYWGYYATGGAARWLLAIGAPLVVAFVWATWIAPKSDSVAGDPVRFLLELAVFGVAVGALAAAGRERLAAILAAAVAIHLGLTFVLDQR